ncbi:MAG: hypothetical protein WC365_08240 [Candidatus Babeliales bacterium]
MTIYEIKDRTKNAPYFFERKSMSFFGQTLKDYHVHKMEDGRFLIFAPMKHEGRIVGTTKRIFDPATNRLEMCPESEA